VVGFRNIVDDFFHRAGDGYIFCADRPAVSHPTDWLRRRRFMNYQSERRFAVVAASSVDSAGRWKKPKTRRICCVADFAGLA
jgi:hypothetical protein